MTEVALSRANITPSSIRAAMAEFDELGRKAFLSKYGYRQSLAYEIRDGRHRYDSKAILGVAYGIEHGCDPLRPHEFSGGAEHCARLLARLGFTVLHRGVALTVDALACGLRLLAKVRRTVARLTLKGHAYLVGLVGCGKAKRKHKAKARDLYTSPAFRMALEIAESRCDETMILSAEHGLVDPDEMIAPYDKTLAKMPKVEREAWTSKVKATLRRRLATKQVRCLLVLAGAAYATAVDGLGYEVVEPMRGMTQGQRMRWLSEQTKALAPALNLYQPTPEISEQRIRYFLPDAQDFVDPSFNFERENRSPDRIRQRDDLYAHEIFSVAPYDGMLLSKGIVESVTGGAGHFSQAQRLRLFREGVRAFYRLTSGLASMGDCGAFSYVDQEIPPFSVEDTIEFYASCGFDYGISTDHVIKAYRPSWDAGLFDEVPPTVRQRQELTVDLAREFLRRSKGQRYVPMGVAQGWSPRSYAASVEALQRMGYTYIAIGGIAGLKSEDLLDVVRAIGTVRKAGTTFHLLGASRPTHLATFAQNGVASFDSTSVLRQAWTDRDKNYHTEERTYTALRIPQVGGNRTLVRRIEAGEVNQAEASAAEREALLQVSRFDAGKVSAGTVLRALVNYESIHSPSETREDDYRQTLEDAPWKRCSCAVCQAIGHHVILFRGSERNRRRGFHNIWVFRRNRALAAAQQIG